ncbi:anti-sigma factor [Amycolatopsis jiangsuensis]|uniref:Regulator of SigK n=1 Tax=Amycolatopsis jiangsuensis TaxID=1181879 RepID=A0A840IKH9_9PSEU|nr:anti-sigma factor [Amycolatopsis jiangsuensis]MBB4682806.1 anti-sigma-K factor RskA [Amycolatopsis jiangsuensis]
MTTPEMHTLTGAYALGALSELERAQFGRHLEQCEACAQEVRELTATSARLGAAMAEEPPPELKQQVIAAMRTTRQLPPRSRHEQGERVRTPRRRPMIITAAAAAAVVGLAAAGVFGGVALHTQNRLDTAQSELSRTRDHYQPVAELLAAPDVRSEHVTSPSGAGGTVLASRLLDRMMFQEAQLPTVASGRVYQAWLMGPQLAPRPAGLLPGGPSGSLVVADGLSGAEQFALSVEPAGGSPTGAPTGDVVLVADMPA